MLAATDAKPQTVTSNSTNLALKKITMNKVYLFTALVFFLVGVYIFIDWVVFWENYYNGDFHEFQKKYIEHFPVFLQSFFDSRLSTLFSIFTFALSGYIFLNQKYIAYKILAITSFIFAAWNLFTLM